MKLLDESPPRGRAGNVYTAWRELVLLQPRDRTAAAALAAEIRRRRAYQPRLAKFVTASARERRQIRCLDALAAWAGTRDAPGSASDYAAWRRQVPDSPTRNTIAATFGSWRDALEAAGVRTDRAHSPDRIAAIRAGAAQSAEPRRAELRRRIIDAVRRCTSELGREPRAGEFLRWRNVHGRDCPSQMTMYRLFPGGFAEVLASARQLSVQLD